MSASPEELPPAALNVPFENCPPVDLAAAKQEVKLERRLEHAITRRKLLINTAVTLVAAKVGYSGIVRPISRSVSAEEWEDRPFDIKVINPMAQTDDPRHYSIFWPGLGQMDVVNGANEYREVTNDRELIAEVELPTRPFTKHDIGAGLMRFYDEHDVGAVTMKTFSMGAVEMFLGMQAADERIVNRILSRDAAPWTRLPEMTAFTAVSSPGDLSDTMRGATGQIIERVADDLHLEPDIILKAIYVTATGDNDAMALLNTVDPQRVIKYITRINDEVFNNSSPWTTLSQFRMLAGYNVVEQAPQFSNLMRPDTRAQYALAGLSDNVLDDVASCGKYQKAAGIWKIPFESFTFNGDHASTLGYADYVKAKRAEDKNFF